MIVRSSGNDEYYTPEYAVRPILPYVSKFQKIWCPFDTEESRFVRLCREAGHTVVATHLSDGHDFFKTSISCDLILSNPPYSKKTEVFARLFSMGLPFAMLVGVVGLFESQKRFALFRDNDFEIMYFDKRVAFLAGQYDIKTSVSPPFSSVYLTSGVLPDKVIFERLEKPSRNRRINN